jgi:cytochrome c oxidase subunit IV
MTEPHVIPVKTYLLVWIALLALLLISWGSAYLSLGFFNVVINFLLSAGKAFLVLIFFMHLKYGGTLTRIFAAAGFFWLLLLFGLTMSDYITRRDLVLESEFIHSYPIIGTQNPQE